MELHLICALLCQQSILLTVGTQLWEFKYFLGQVSDLSVATSNISTEVPTTARYKKKYIYIIIFLVA